VEITASFIEFEGQEYNCAFVRDLTDQRQEEDLLRRIATEVLTRTGSDYFQGLVRFVGQEMGFTYAFVGEIVPSAGRVRTRAFWYRDGPGENFSFDLRNTPCEMVAGRQPCFFARGLQAQFPDNHFLADMGAEAFVGVPIFAPDGTPIGLVSAIGTQPLAEGTRDRLISLMQILSSRAAAEMQRQTMEQALRESEAWFRTLVEATNDWIWEVDLEGRFVYCSPRVRDLLGYEPEELRGRTPFDFMPPTEASFLRDVLDACVRDRKPFLGVTKACLHRSGHTVILESNALPMLSPGGEILGFRGIDRDITRRWEMENALRREKERAQTYLDLVGVMMVALDDQGRVTLANRRTCEVLGVAEEEILGQDWFERFLPSERSATEKTLFLQTLQGKRNLATTYENRIHDASGREHLIAWHDVLLRNPEGQIVGALSSGEDVTDQRKAEDDLRHLRNLMANIIDSMPSVLIGVDREGNITRFNREARSLVEPECPLVVGDSLTVCFPALSSFMDRVRQAITERRVLKEDRFPHPRRPETGLMELTIYPLEAEGIEGAVIRMDDVTERVRLEEIMVQTEKMLSVGGLAAGMAHEINNPLAGILQNAQVVSERLGGDHPANRAAAEQAGTTLDAIRTFMELRKIPPMLGQIRESGLRTARIVQNMLAFSRKSEGNFTEQDLPVLLDTAIELLETDFDARRWYDFRRIDIVRDYEPGLPKVQCERGMMQQVFHNILKNGAEAMWELHKESARTDERPRFRLQLRREAEFVRLQIADNGPGMSETIRRRVFEPFFTTKPVGQGTGLGLSVSYFIVVEYHQGRLEVQSSPGQGTTFLIFLPIEPKPVVNPVRNR
jgi:PAS domain S-box-containing protein